MDRRTCVVRLLLGFGVTVVMVAPVGCGPGLLLERPERWPQEWAARSLYNTPNAFIYASSKEAAGEVARLVQQQAEKFREQHRRQPAKGLAVVTDTDDALFTPDVKTLVAMVAKQKVREAHDGECDKTAVAVEMIQYQVLALELGVEGVCYS